MRLRNLVFSVAVVVALVMAVPAFAQQANLGGVSGEVTASPNVRAAEPAPDPMLNSTDQWGTSNWRPTKPPPSTRRSARVLGGP